MGEVTSLVVKTPAYTLKYLISLKRRDLSDMC